MNKHTIAVCIFLAGVCLSTLNAQPSDRMALKMMRIEQRSESGMSKNDIADPLARYSQMADPSFNTRRDGEPMESAQMEMNTRTLVTSMLRLMSGLLQPHLSDDHSH